MASDYVLDACALIAYLQKETGWEKVNSLLIQASSQTSSLLMHKATVAEVYYDALYTSSEEDAMDLLQSLTRLPVHFTSLLNNDFIQSVGFYKTRYKVSFADCFVLATAEMYDATIVTSDRHEFGAIEKDKRLRFEWLR